MPSKTRKLVRIPISRSADLSRHGYSNIMEKTVAQRHRALMKAVGSAGKSLKARAEKTRKVIRKLNALAIVQKNTNPEFAERVRSDQQYMSKYLDGLNEKLAK